MSVVNCTDDHRGIVDCLDDVKITRAVRLAVAAWPRRFLIRLDYTASPSNTALQRSRTLERAFGQLASV
jgi:hypothetical protein